MKVKVAVGVPWTISKSLEKGQEELEICLRIETSRLQDTLDWLEY